MKRKAEDPISSCENNKSIRLTFNSLYDAIWKIIFTFALSKLENFTTTWCAMRRVSKKWNQMLDPRILELSEDRFIKQAFILAVRCNRVDWINHFLDIRKIDSKFDEYRAIRDTLRYDHVDAFEILIRRVNLEKYEEIQRWISESSAKKIILFLIKRIGENNPITFHFSFKRDYFHTVKTTNILSILLKKDKYDIMDEIIRYWQSNIRCHRLDHSFCTVLDKKLLKIASKKGYLKLIQIFFSYYQQDKWMKIFSEIDNKAAYGLVLKEAIKSANMDLVRHVLSLNYPLKKWIEDGMIECIVRSFEDIFDELVIHIDRMEIIDIDFRYLLNIAIQYHRRRIIKTIMKRLDVNESIFNDHRAIKHCDLLFVNKPDMQINAKLVSLAASYGYFKIVKKLMVDPRLKQTEIDMNEVLSYTCRNTNDAEFVKQLIDKHHADPNARNECLSIAALNRNNDIVRTLINHPQINQQSVTLAIQTILADTLHFDTLDILLTCPIVSNMTLSRMIEIACDNQMMVMELLRRHWENNDAVPLHWRFFCLMSHIKDPWNCFSTIIDSEHDIICIHHHNHYDVIEKEEPTTSHVMIHLKNCKYFHKNISTCKCKDIIIPTDGKSECTLQSMLAEIKSDLSKYTNKLQPFMSKLLFTKIKLVFAEMISPIKF